AGGSPDEATATAVDIYDAGTRNWTTHRVSVPARADDNLALVTAGTKVLVLVRQSSLPDMWGVPPPSDVVEIYDSATDQWSQARLSQPRGRGFAIASVGGKALFAGGKFGEDGPDPRSDVVDLYDS